LYEKLAYIRKDFQMLSCFQGKLHLIDYNLQKNTIKITFH